MIFLEPQRSPFDLQWWMFGVPVRVSVWFWVLSALLGWGWFGSGGIGYLGLWVGCVFASILLHEFGHVAAFRWFGSDAAVLLFGGGGLAIPNREPPLAGQRIIVALAGPAAQLLLFAALWAGGPLLLRAVGPSRPLVAGYVMLWWINLVWPLFNLLPIWPLDGGRVSRELFVLASPANGLIGSLYLSMGVAGVLAVHSFFAGQGRPLIPFLPFGGFYTALFMAMFALESYQLIQREKLRRPRWDDDTLPWER